MEYRILGPLEALDGDRQISIGGTRQRAVLALLLLHGNETLGRDVLVDSLWGEEAPPTAGKVLQNCVSALRKELPADTIRTVGGAYALTLGPEELDRDRFERLLAEGRAALTAGQNVEAAEQLRAALALWRGSPLADLAYEPFTRDEITRLEELHIAAVEDRVDAELGLGLHDELVPELEGLVARHPLRERLRGQLMLALYQAGRQAEALEVYRAGRRTFMAELGIEPGRALHELERSILAQDPSLEASRKVASAPRPGRAAASPLIGRDRELSLLEAGLEDALAGRGRLFVVVGAARSGKTHLADELASLAKQRGCRILWGRGWEGAPAYWPWTQALRDAGHSPDTPATDDPAAEFRFFEAVTETLRGEAAAQPVLLVFDDLQAADESSVRLLEFLASELPEMAALVLALGRPETLRLEELGRHATRTLQL
jgi:DNA-binding SARP family transcriptional activator